MTEEKELKEYKIRYIGKIKAADIYQVNEIIGKNNKLADIEVTAISIIDESSEEYIE